MCGCGRSSGIVLVPSEQPCDPGFERDKPVVFGIVERAARVDGQSDRSHVAPHLQASSPARGDEVVVNGNLLFDRKLGRPACRSWRARFVTYHLRVVAGRPVWLRQHHVFVGCRSNSE